MQSDDLQENVLHGRRSKVEPGIRGNTDTKAVKPGEVLTNATKNTGPASSSMSADVFDQVAVGHMQPSGVYVCTSIRYLQQHVVALSFPNTDVFRVQRFGWSKYLPPDVKVFSQPSNHPGDLLRNGNGAGPIRNGGPA
jgi:hypothetical protein